MINPMARPGDNPHSVAIVGAGCLHPMVPWGREGWEIWSMNDVGVYVADSIQCYTRWFQFHTIEYMKRHYPRGITAMEWWETARGVPLYMDRVHPEYPDSVRFPKAEVEALTPHGEYHASSFDWMLALAILEGFKTVLLLDVALYGSPFMNGEPLSGRPCMEYWAGVAEGRGIGVHTGPRTGDLFRIVHTARHVSDLQYGFDDEPGFELPEPWTDHR